MNNNARLDGFTVHPLDLFPTNKNLNDNANKITLNTANLDGFKIHPIDLFVSHDNNPFKNKDYNPSSNYKISNTQTNNNINTVQYGTITNDGNIFYKYQYPNNINSYQPSIKTTIIKKEIIYNNPNPVSLNTTTFKDYNQNPADVKEDISFIPFQVTNLQNKVAYPDVVEKKTKIIKLPKATIQNITPTYDNNSPPKDVITYQEPYLNKFSIYSINNQPQLQPQLQPQIQPQLQPQIQPQLQSQLQPQPQPQLQLQSQPTTHLLIQTQLQPQPLSQPHLQPNPQTNPQPLPQLQHQPKSLVFPQFLPQSQQMKTKIIYRDYPIQNNNNNYVNQIETKNAGINNGFDYNHAPKTISITNINYITPQIQQYNLINQNQKIYELNNSTKNINLNLKKLPPTKIMNLDTNNVQSNKIFSLNNRQNININNQIKGLSISNLNKGIPYSTASYEPEPSPGEYQTRTSLIGKLNFDSTNIDRMPRNKTPTIMGKTLIPIQNIITPVKKTIMAPKDTTIIIPKISTNIVSTPTKSPIISNQFSPIKSPLISSKFDKPVVITKKIINSPRNSRVIPLSTIPLNTNDYNTYSLTSLNKSFSQRAYNPQNLKSINASRNMGMFPFNQNITTIGLPSRQRSISQSPFKYNFPSYFQNQRNIVKINNLKLGNTIYTKRI